LTVDALPFHVRSLYSATPEVAIDKVDYGAA
jgi:hypothetical protein